MHYLRLALLAEGPTDHRFLPVVLRRLTLDLCLRRAARPVEVEDEVRDLMLLRMSSAQPGESRRDQVRRIVLDMAGSFNILFVHADGGSDPLDARAHHVEPLAVWMEDVPDLVSSRTVAVVPVREMEAWALADGEALREAFGTVLPNEDLGIPARPRDVETIFDPKQLLESVYSRVVGRRRKKDRAANFLSAIGERSRFELLRQVPAFQELERDLAVALEALGYFR